MEGDSNGRAENIWTLGMALIVGLRIFGLRKVPGVLGLRIFGLWKVAVLVGLRIFRLRNVGVVLRLRIFGLLEWQ